MASLSPNLLFCVSLSFLGTGELCSLLRNPVHGFANPECGLFLSSLETLLPRNHVWHATPLRISQMLRYLFLYTQGKRRCTEKQISAHDLLFRVLVLLSHSSGPKTDSLFRKHGSCFQMGCYTRAQCLQKKKDFFFPCPRMGQHQPDLPSPLCLQ